MADQLVVNVDNWGSGPKPLVKGDVVPADHEADMEWAQENKVVVTADEYRLEHPEWKAPGEAAKADAESAPAPRAGRASSS